MPNYTVKQGDCIESIALKHGHLWQTLWDDSNNADLRNKRKEPNLLFPGDVVFIPEKRIKEESGQTEQRHRFMLKGVPSKLQMQLLDEEDEPRSNMEYIIEIDGTFYRGVTNADGWIRRPIMPDAKRGKLIIIEDGTQESYELNLGHMNPIDQDIGVQQRLNNLGFDCGATNGALNEETKDAIIEFQNKYRLPTTGKPDEATRQKLEKIHGS